MRRRLTLPYEQRARPMRRLSDKQLRTLLCLLHSGPSPSAAFPSFLSATSASERSVSGSFFLLLLLLLLLAARMKEAPKKYFPYFFLIPAECRPFLSIRHLQWPKTCNSFRDLCDLFRGFFFFCYLFQMEGSAF